MSPAVSDLASPSLRSIQEFRGRLAAALIETGRLSETALNNLQRSADWPDEPIEHILLREGVLAESDILDLVSTVSGVARLEPGPIADSQEAIALVPAQAAVHYRVAPLALEDHHLVLATDHLRAPEEQTRMRVVLGHPIRWKLCSARHLAELITHFYGVGIATFIATRDGGGRPVRRDESGPSVEESGMPEFVDEILRDAMRSGATDLHIEPAETSLQIRYRIDGVLYPIRLPDGLVGYSRSLISSIKVMAQLNIAERRLPQDGRISKTLDGQSFDLRVSVLPTRFGESVEIRLLNRNATFLRLDQLGFPDKDRRQIEQLIDRPNGLIVFTGPTGSGKTTSLYAAMAYLNHPERKIITLEDPVEYQILGITQLQVQPQIGFTFANGLRSILRHDPDVILVGEIRDNETAAITVSAALTGHTVFSTLHTNDSAAAPARLIDMGVEPYLVSSCLQGIIAQRLLRRVCPRCREEISIEESAHLDVSQCLPDLPPDAIRAWQGRGCPDCRFTGYQGRIAIYEFLEIDDSIRTMIIESTPGAHILRYAMQNTDITPLRTAGWKLVLAGECTIQDLLRTTNPSPTAVRYR